MNIERKELADLFAQYLNGTLVNDDNIATWERLRKSNDPTIAHGCQILVDQIEDTEFNLDLLDKSEWDYIERVRLALLGNATIVKRKTLRFDWRNLLSGVGFFAFILLTVQYGYGYHLLPVTALLGMAIFVVSKFFPRETSQLPYDSIISPFGSFSDLKMAYDSSDSFKKIRHIKPASKRNTLLGHCFWALVASCAMAILSPVMLLVLAFPDTEPQYQAIAG
jgi:hypothetical protein